MVTKGERSSGNEKRKIYKRIFLMLSAVGMLSAGLIGYGIYWAFFDMNRLPTGNHLTEETSPDGKYTVKAYVTSGGATTSYAIRGELVFNQENKKPKNIYWNTKEEHADIMWVDLDTVVINGHLLKVSGDTFDFRHE